jgi:hypothetical protein
MGRGHRKTLAEGKTGRIVNFEPLEKIANAVLYEGFLLYPYRKSAVKNQGRWHFGTVGPVGGSYPVEMQTEVLVEANPRTIVGIKVRFLQDRTEREWTTSLHPSSAAPGVHSFSFGELTGAVHINAAPVTDNLIRLSVRILNLSSNTGAESRTQPSPAHMLSCHTLLGVQDGAFISLVDPPDAYHTAAAACRSVGTWPVLAGSEGERTLMLSSPIILYDYPQIAPESKGDFYDSTEMDEMLTLRVLTLSDQEKQEVRDSEDHGREILERTEGLPPEHVAKLHGIIRSLRNTAKLEFRQGDRVRLRPREKGDVFDIALNGKTAVVESVERDFEDRVHIAVTVDDDPGRDLGALRQIGHRFFFSPEEVELL